MNHNSPNQDGFEGKDSKVVSRRDALKQIGVGIAAGALAMGGSGLLKANQVFADATGERPNSIVYYDLTYLYNYDLTNPQQARMAYDHMHLVTTLQGIVNRDRPKLYVNFVNSDQFGKMDIDQYWLNKLRAPGEWLFNHAVEQISGLEALVQRFRRYIQGAVVYDPKVPATSNVASTVAGVEDLVAIRYDTTPGSVYSQFIGHGPKADQKGHAMHLPVKTWLIQPNGSSLFTGHGTIPGTHLSSSGSAKCDAYLWAKTQYLDTGKCNASSLGYYIDAYWLTMPSKPEKSEPQNSDLMNHDYLVSQRGFIFDLDPFADETPVDDPNQPLGTDQQTLCAILSSAYNQSHGEMIAIHGFVPWKWKYSNVGQAGGKHTAVGAEWECVHIISAYNAYLDADAEMIDGMANASFFHHYPLKSLYSQNPPPTTGDLQKQGFIEADGSVSPRRYVMFYVGDYDSAAWIYHAFPRFWDDPNRGSVPLNWAFNPNLENRIAPAFVFSRKTRTPNDFFIAGDSGAGYVNPGMLDAPRAYSNLPDGWGAWEKHCQYYYRKWDISITGFIIDGVSPRMSEKGQQTYAQFSTNGFADQDGPTFGIVGNTPFTAMGGSGGRSYIDYAASIERNLQGDTSTSPYNPEFHVARTVLQTPTWHKQVVQKVHSDVPNAQVTFVDAFTFFALMRQYLKDQVIASFNGPYASVVPGQEVQMTILLTSYLDTAATGTVSLSTPSGWVVDPSTVSFNLDAKATGSVSFTVTAPADLAIGKTQEVKAVVTMNGHPRSYGFETIASTSAMGKAVLCTTLGTTNISKGVSQLEVSGDGVTAAVTIGGKSARQTVKKVKNDLNMYFALQKGIADNGTFHATFTIEYYDTGTNSWVLQYDSDNPNALLNGAYATAKTVKNTNSSQWKQLTVTVDDARFANRENGGADFRINSSAPVIIHSVGLVVTGPGVKSVQLC